MITRTVALALFALGLTGSSAHAASITNTFEWGSSPATTQTFTDALLPTWTHTLNIDPLAINLTGSIEIRHSGNKANNAMGSSGEFWLMNSQSAVFIGALGLSWSAAAGDFFATTTLALPTSLLPSSLGSPWTLALALAESTNQTDSITLDYAKLTVNYDLRETAPVPAPEPATLSLLGLGLAGAAVRRYRRR